MSTELDILRRAADLTRARAEAIASEWDGPWRISPADSTQVHDAPGCLVASAEGVDEALHIATADPRFLLAIADWWEVVADYGVPAEGQGTRNFHAALNAARIYLRETDHE